MILQLDPNYPSRHRVERIVALLEADGVIAIPTDTTYALACLPDKKAAVDRLLALRRLDKSKPLSLVFRDIAHIAEYAIVPDSAFRILKRYLPGPYTFILEANRKLPRFIGDKRKRIGVRVPNVGATQLIVELANRPLIVTTAIDPETNEMVNDPWVAEETFGHGLAAVVDCGDAPGQFSSVVDLTTDPPVILRAGVGDVSEFESEE